jgi:DegV family protein with EDD domain
MPHVAVVTDSTAGVSPATAEELGIVVVPLQVVIGATSYADGVDPEASPDSVAKALRDYLPVSTSRPSPELLLETYEEAAARGAGEIVSVHLSAEVSATHESALLAAKRSPVPVHVVDTRQIGAGTGWAAVAAAHVLADGGTCLEAAEAARRRAAATTALFSVDTLEYLRRGGRIGSAAALLGSALAVKPILEVAGGRVEPREKVRTRGRALSRLEELAVLGAEGHDVDVTVCHLANLPAAEDLARRLQERLAEQLGDRQVEVAEVAAVLGAHVGPGVVGVVVAPILSAVHSDEEGPGEHP